MGVSRVTGGDARDGQRKGKRHMGRIAICSESDFPSCEAIHPLQGWVAARTPSLPNAKRGLMLIKVARPFNAVLSVFFVAAMAAIAADDSVKAGSNRGNGIFGFAENPNLNHVAGFAVVGGFIESGCNDDTG